MESVFSTKYIQDIFQEMYQEIESAGKVSYEYTKTKFNDSVTILLETFGSVTDVEEKRILEKIPQKHAQDFSTFLDISKTHKKIKDAIDPRIQLKKKL